MYCCDQDQCPNPELEDGKKCFCDARPFGLCDPDYSDSYCETYNNNPFGPKPQNREEAIRASCCSSVNYGDNNGGGSQPKTESPGPNRNRCSSACEGGLDFSKVLQYKQVYHGFNENVNAGLKENDPCCKQNQNQSNGNRCC